MAAANLLEANLAVFERHFPALHARMKEMTAPLTSLIFDGEDVIDIDVGGGRLYRGDGRKLASAQVEAFMKTPFQVGYLLPDHNAFDSMLSRRKHQELLDSLARHGVTDMPLVSNGDIGYCFIMGVGLGYHLPLLLERIHTPHVVICEAFEEFLLASLRVLDWGRVVELCENRGAVLHLICSRNAEQISQQVGELVRQCGPVYLDGSYFYQHYPLWAYEEARRRLINELPREMMARGYFEDERKMVRNTVTNFQKYNVHVLTADFRPRTHTPVFVIGAGPSVDEAMPFIQQWRDHAIVFSAGSGLQPCLKNGIIPDFHVEIENTYNIVTKLNFILGQYLNLFPNGKFDGIHFVASATVNPSVTSLFSNVLFFFRDSSTSSLSFGSEFGVHTGVGPTVANTSLGTIARMGLGDVYLFGVDCGWRDQFSHHSRDSIYYTSDAFRNAQMTGAYTLPGNFGGQVESDTVFDWCRNMLEQAIAAFHLTVYNCSDGALLAGATPRVAEALNFEGEPLDRQAIIAEIVANRPSFAPGEFFKNRPMSVYQEELDRFEAALMPLVDQASAENWTFRQFHDAFWGRLGGEAADRNLGMGAWVQSSSIGMFKQSSILLNRIPDPDKRRAVMGDFIVLFRQAHEEMFAEARAHLEQIDAWVKGGPEPEWADGLPRVPGTTY